MMAGATSGTPIRLGMVGGGTGAFIGAVHRLAARLDGQYELVAGALSSDPDRARASAAELGLQPERAYGDFAEMAQAEAERADGVEAVAIVTPNHLHAPVATAFLKAGIHVICDKPLAVDVGQADALVKLARASGRVFAVTYNYSGYAMVRQAREMAASGVIGAIRLVQVEYVQDWLAKDVHSRQADWRTDPARAGPGGAIADIGSHAAHLATFVSGRRIESVAADLTSFVPGRRLDDNAQTMLRFERGAKGALWASQVAPGNENALRLRVYGETGGLEWSQEEPDRLWYSPLGEPKTLITRGGGASGRAASRVTRVPAGHPEGYLEGFANIYAEVARAIRAAAAGTAPPGEVLYPTVEDGAEGVRFVDACVRSSGRNAAWVRLGPKSPRPST